jgi:hypothetical protein
LGGEAVFFDGGVVEVFQGLLAGAAGFFED